MEGMTLAYQQSIPLHKINPILKIFNEVYYEYIMGSFWL